VLQKTELDRALSQSHLDLYMHTSMTYQL